MVDVPSRLLGDCSYDFSLIELPFQMALLGMEAHAVIGLRMSAIGRGGPSALLEAHAMVAEKVSALAEAAGTIKTRGLGTGCRAGISASCKSQRSASAEISQQRRLKRNVDYPAKHAIRLGNCLTSCGNRSATMPHSALQLFELLAHLKKGPLSTQRGINVVFVAEHRAVTTPTCKVCRIVRNRTFFRAASHKQASAAAPMPK